MRVIYFGTPSIAAHILENLLQHSVNVVAVVTKPDKRQGRDQKLAPSAVKEFLLRAYPDIPILQPAKISTEEYREKLQAFNADLFLVVAYGEIIKQSILDIPKLGCLNVHASLLPRYRGAAPMHRAIINGEKETGVTIMEMVLALDAGPILHKEKVEISKEMNVGELEVELEKLGSLALLKTLENLKEKRANKQLQEEALATYAPKITPQECEVHWNQPSKKIHDLIRGVTPFPGAWCQIIFKKPSGEESKRLKIKKTEIVKNNFNSPPGTVLKYEKDHWMIATQDGAIRLLEVQLEGKKTMNASEFIRGYSSPKF
jgi:methionyl-tRNA formyltransferase